MYSRTFPRLLGALLVALGAVGSTAASAATGGPPGPNGPPIYSNTGGFYYPSNNYNDPNATQACGVGSLTQYVGLGYNGCSVGAVTFYNFTFNRTFASGPDPVSSPTTLNAGNVTIAPDASGNPSLRFTDPTDWTVPLNGQAVTYTIEYFIDPPIDILGYDLSDDPFGSTLGTTYVQANICDNTEFDQYGYDCIRELDPEFRLDGTNYLTGNGVTFAPGTQFLDVQLRIHVEPGASIPGFAGTVTPAASALVPEPELLALEGIGGVAFVGAAIGQLRRRRNRTA